MWEGCWVLLTGATGFIGSHLLARLLDAGARVGVLVRPGREADMAGCRVCIADLTDAAAVRRAVEDIRPEVVFHLAAAGVTDPFLPVETALRVNLWGTLNLLHALEGTARVVVARTPGEPLALNVYSASKAAAWVFCRMYHRTRGWPIVGVMPFQVYGPGQPERSLIPAAIIAALQGRDFPIHPGEQVRDWVYVNDVVEGFLRAGLSSIGEGETFQLGTGRGHSVAQVVKMIFALVGGPGKPLVGALPYRPGEVMEQVADPSLAQEVLGWEPQVALEEGLRRTIAWFADRDNLPKLNGCATMILPPFDKKGETR